MNEHQKKMIAPIAVAVILVAYYIIYFGFLIALLEGAWKIILAIVPLAFSALIVKVCIDRIKEIRKGEEDDLGQY
ncbi:MAG: hypothetical protein IKK75_10130 [Clostridia bacterium]|nr:hypothetical protein [Clostridia bacterium]